MVLLRPKIIAIPAVAKEETTPNIERTINQKFKRRFKSFSQTTDLSKFTNYFYEQPPTITLTERATPKKVKTPFPFPYLHKRHNYNNLGGKLIENL